MPTKKKKFNKKKNIVKMLSCGNAILKREIYRNKYRSYWACKNGILSYEELPVHGGNLELLNHFPQSGFLDFAEAEDPLRYWFWSLWSCHLLTRFPAPCLLHNPRQFLQVPRLKLGAEPILEPPKKQKKNINFLGHLLLLRIKPTFLYKSKGSPLIEKALTRYLFTGS